MTELTRVCDVERLLKPVIESMLSDTELRSLTVRVVRVADGADGRALPAQTAISTNQVWIRWQVLGEDGGSGSLRLDEGVDALVRFVQSEFQDFIAESRFGWGELRGPRDLP